MQVLHALWKAPGLLLWAEGGVAGAARGRRRVHPAALPAEAVGEALARLAPPEALARCHRLEAAEEDVHLPTAGSRPLPSPLLAESRPERAPHIRPWRVPGLRLEAGEAVTLLAGLAEAGDPLAEGLEGAPVAAGEDLRAWRDGARWVLSLVARERLVPGLEWRPVLDDPGDAAALDLLARRLPPAARAAADPALPARAVLVDFARRAVADLARRWAAAGKPLPTRWPVGPRAWVEGLRTGTVPRKAEALAPEVERWLERGAPEGYRTCFRLESPPDEPRKRRAPSWTVSLHLQAADDPSLLVPAGDVWAHPDRIPARGAAHPQDRLLGDLGRAVNAFPELARALREPCPTGLDLAPDEVARFLEHRALVLREMGLGVQLPANLASGRRALGLRLSAGGSSSAGPSAASGVLGLANLVDYRWEVSLGGETMDPEEFRRLADLKTPLVRVRGQWVLLDRDMVQRALRHLERPAEAMALGEVLRLPATSAVPVEVRFEGSLAPLGASGASLELEDPPEGLRARLRPYQVRGFSWLAFLGDRGLGACLADDMGLGKTVQTIARLLRDRGHGPSLLVCPTSVVGNWVRELQRFAPDLRVLVYHGSERLEQEDLVAEARAHDLVITTYGLARREAEVLGRVRWHGVVLDEAQNVKNPASGQAKAVRSLPAAWRVALTGTPVENRLTDLWSLMEFLNPGLLGSQASFQRDFVVPVQAWGDDERAGRLRAMVQPFLLRRLKSDPAILPDLPEKEEIKTFCPLTREQATLYQATVQAMLTEVEEAEEGIDRRGKVLAALLRLKQICNHPAQFLGDGSPLPGRSGKLNRLEEMLEEVLAEGDRALVFTQFAELAQRLSRHLRERFGREVLCLHGGVARRERDALVERFQAEDGPPLFVLSLKAGGVGLNLTRASRVFHFDRWWNPAVENQATDRAYRIGQTRGVQVYKFLCAGTLEESIDRLIESKLALAESVVGVGEGWLTELDDRQLREVLTLKPEAFS